MLVSVLVE